MKKYLLAVCLLFALPVLLDSCTSPTKPYPTFSWTTTGINGAPVTISYSRNGQHIDISANGAQCNQGFLPMSMDYQYLAPGDVVTLTIAYTSNMDASATVKINFYEDKNPLASASGTGTATCSASIK